MIVNELVSKEIKALDPKNTASEAKELFEEYCLCHLPVVKGQNLLGILPSDAINNEENPDKQIKDFKEDFVLARAEGSQHFLNIFDLVADNELTLIPVVENGSHYKGSIVLVDLLNYFADVYAFKEPGGIFTLVVPYRNYDLSEISKIIESNNAKLLSLYTQMDEDAYTLTVTIKVNTQDLKSIRATFERYDYHIDVHETYDTRSDELKDRYDLLMKYLDT